jgi:hypothetical protein
MHVMCLSKIHYDPASQQAGRQAGTNTGCTQYMHACGIATEQQRVTPPLSCPRVAS